MLNLETLRCIRMVPACEPFLSWREKCSSITVEGARLLVSEVSPCSFFVYLDMLALFISLPASFLVELENIEAVEINPMTV